VIGCSGLSTGGLLADRTRQKADAIDAHRSADRTKADATPMVMHAGGRERAPAGAEDRCS
jgi:hypothetical protein